MHACIVITVVIFKLSVFIKFTNTFIHLEVVQCLWYTEGFYLPCIHMYIKAYSSTPCSQKMPACIVNQNFFPHTLESKDRLQSKVALNHFHNTQNHKVFVCLSACYTYQNWKFIKYYIDKCIKLIYLSTHCMVVRLSISSWSSSFLGQFWYIFNLLNVKLIALLDLEMKIDDIDLVIVHWELNLCCHNFNAIAYSV